MKSAKLLCITAMALLVALVIPASLAAQEHPTKHYQYQFVDLGTLGGPASLVLTISSHGFVIGDAETSVSDPPHSNPAICGPGTYVYHGFEWGKKSGVKDLGALAPAEDDCSGVGGINASGEITGVSENGVIDPLTGFIEIRAVVWKDGQIEDLGTLGGNHSWSAGSINDRGQVVGLALNKIPDPYSFFDFGNLGSTNGTQTRAFLWPYGEKRKMRDLGTLGGPDAAAQFVNERGQVAGYSYTNGTPNSYNGQNCPRNVPTQDPFFWEKGTITDIGTLGGNCGGPAFMNNHGQVVGQSNLRGDVFYHAFFWEKGKKMQDLGTFGGNYGWAYWINDAGEVVGGATLKGDQVNHAFLWKKGKKMRDLGILMGDSCDQAFSINSQGQVVGASGDCNNVHARSFLWENGTIYDLNKLIPPGSALQLVFASVISDSGEIAGGGLPSGCTNIDTCGHAYVLIPCDDNHGNGGDCEELTEGATATAQSSSALVTQNPSTMAEGSSSTNDRIGGARGRFDRRYPYRGFAPYQPR